MHANGGGRSIGNGRALRPLAAANKVSELKDLMINIRAMFGDTIENSDQRLELIIALQAALPRWRAAVGQ